MRLVTTGLGLLVLAWILLALTAFAHAACMPTFDPDGHMVTHCVPDNADGSVRFPRCVIKFDEQGRMIKLCY